VALRRRSLTPDELHLVGLISEIVVPQGPDSPIRTEGPVDVPAAVARLVALLPPTAVVGFGLGLRIVDALPFFLVGVPKRMRSLTDDERARYLGRLADHRLYGLRMLFKGTAGLCLSAYHYDPRVARAIGYVPEEGPGWPRAESPS